MDLHFEDQIHATVSFESTRFPGWRGARHGLALKKKPMDAKNIGGLISNYLGFAIFEFILQNPS